MLSASRACRWLSLLNAEVATSSLHPVRRPTAEAVRELLGHAFLSNLKKMLPKNKKPTCQSTLAVGFTTARLGYDS